MADGSQPKISASVGDPPYDPRGDQRGPLLTDDNDRQLEAVRWIWDDPTRHRKNHFGKARIAVRVGRETTMTPSWVAERLCMDSLTT